MVECDFRQVDVFTAQPLLGNPVAVVHDAGAMTTEMMHRFTNWTNLSEATFLVPVTAPGADYHVRIFCPGRELPFAGHPTLGTCHAWLEAGGEPRSGTIVQQCGAGLVRIRRSGSVLSFAAPPLRRTGPLSETEVAQLAAGLGLQPHDIVDHQWCDNGPGWQAVLLESADQVLALKPDPQILAGLDIGVIGPHAQGSIDYEVRAFFPGNSGLTEDPVTGSLNAALAQWLIGSGRAPDSYIAAQGTVLGRAGRVQVSRDAADIWIGGECTTVIHGTCTVATP